eukprot:jgi/Mesvir1/14622/Mv05292-RA.1
MSLTQMARTMRSDGYERLGRSAAAVPVPAAPAAPDFPMEFPESTPQPAPYVDAPSRQPSTHIVGSAVVEGRKSAYSVVAALAGVSVTIGVLKFAPERFPRWFENRDTGRVDKIRVNVAGIVSGIVTYGIVLMVMNFRK